MDQIMAKHEKAALMFSGGKDSLATLLLMRPYWDKITVIWVNTGNMFPENEAIVRQFAAQVPHFLEKKTDVMAWREKNGIPSDVVPVRWTDFGQQLVGEQPIKIASAWDCCLTNISMPGVDAINEVGATLIIRGQREEEKAKNPFRSGHVESGFEFLFPIEAWSHDNVLKYLTEQGFNYPEFFHFEESSLDCINCTAFCNELKDRDKWMKKNYPHERYENICDIRLVTKIVEKELELLKIACQI